MIKKCLFYRLWYSDLWCTNDTKFEEFKLKKPLDLIIIWVQCYTVQSYARSKYINYSENTITTTTIYIHFHKPRKSIKIQTIQVLFKVHVSPTNSLNWKGDWQLPPIHTPTSRPDWLTWRAVRHKANSSTTQWGLEIID